MTMLSTYNPDGQARCLTCEKLVEVAVVGGNLTYSPMYMEFVHKDCSTRWKCYVNSGEIEIIGNRHG